MNELDRLTTALADRHPIERELGAGGMVWVRLLALALALGPTGGAASAPSPAQARYDVIIRHGRVLDGSGNPFFYGDLGIRGDTIDARGQYVTPGFIALHEHIERSILDGHGTLPNLTTQGFTTAVIDAEGRDVIWPLSQQRSAFH